MASPMISVAKGGKFHQIDRGDPFPSTFRRMKSIVAAFAEANRNPSEDLWLLLNGLWDELQDPGVIIYVLTEHLHLVEEYLRDSVKATIVVGTPTSTNIMFSIESAVSRCASEGKLLLWFCCHDRLKELTNGTKISLMRPMDGWENALTGEDLRRPTSRLPPTCVVTVVLEVCHAGNLWGLPFEIAADGTMVAHQAAEAAASKGPRIICISACSSNEKAWFGDLRTLQCGAFTLMLYAELGNRRREGRPGVYLREVGRVIAPDLEPWGGQHPVVALSHAADQDAPLVFPGFH
ncbi:hypothetical protein FRB94_001152 [Tulasnella sp. JGI-2019a]|nr:hypothetical protein FRB93_000893 [Tulasnella sp. JGI-2019a]KAG9005877.1 hypothetical protein FRB94_001152 [Tulasnella sp. JGI-2019a]